MRIFLAVLFIAGSSSVRAVGNADFTLPVDTLTGKVVYQYTFEVSKKLSQQRIYTSLQNWFKTHPEVCNPCNRPESNRAATARNYPVVQKEFKNTTPLQSLDPESSRMAVKIIDRYYANEDEVLKVVYTEFYVVITVSGNRVHAEITDIRYNHFNHRSYFLQRIGKWSDVLSLDPINTIEHLLTNGQDNEEILKYIAHIDKDIRHFFQEMQSHLQNTAALVSAE